jgi:integration host factor subunit beta
VVCRSKDRTLPPRQCNWTSPFQGKRKPRRSGLVRVVLSREIGGAVLRSELIKKIAEPHPHLRYSDVELVVETIFTSIGTALTRGNRVEIRGFGIFFVKHREAHTGRNPRTGATVEVSPKVIPFLRIGKHLHARLNEER